VQPKREEREGERKITMIMEGKGTVTKKKKRDFQIASF
jgi:hypothetical protein